MAKAQYIFFEKLQSGLKNQNTQKLPEKTQSVQKPIEKQDSFDFFCSEIAKLFEPIDPQPQQLKEPTL